MEFLKRKLFRYICLGGVVCAMMFGSVACGSERMEKTEAPTWGETAEPTASPATWPTASPTAEPTASPATWPTASPTTAPTVSPTAKPTASPTTAPTVSATTEPATGSTAESTVEPTTEPTPVPAPECSALRVDGTKLVDANGNQVQLRGVSTHGLAWYPGYVNEECFRQLKEEWGANVVRLAMYTGENGGYCTGGDKEALKALVKDGVKYATDLGLYVIIDWHILSDGNPNTYLEEAKTFFGEMAETYADYTNVLYEICNEPNGGTTWSQVKEYAKQVISVIRQKDEDGIILVGTPNWCQYVDQAAADPLTGYENVMYTLHFYAATHTDGLRNSMVAALDAGLPLFVSEYGICDASGSGNIDEYQANQWVKLMDEYHVSYVAWNLSNKGENSAFFKSECSKTNGFTQDDLSASGKWLYKMLQERTEGISMEITAPTTAPNISADPTAMPTDAPDNVESSDNQLSTELAYVATVVNSWEQDGHICSQYALTVTNNTEETVKSWSISLPFEQEITLISSWNGNYQVEGTMLTISSVDYNGHIDAGGSVTDIGFILQSGENP